MCLQISSSTLEYFDNRLASSLLRAGPGPLYCHMVCAQRCKGIFVWLLAKHNSVNKLLREKSHITYHRASTFKSHCCFFVSLVYRIENRLNRYTLSLRRTWFSESQVGTVLAAMTPLLINSFLWTLII